MPPDPNAQRDQEDAARQAGEDLELDGDESQVSENEDGSAFVVLDDATDAEEGGDFFENLAEVLEPPYFNGLAVDILDLIELDVKSRDLRDKQYAEGIQRSGLSETPKGADFEGSSIVVHPMILEASIDFSSRISKEMLPPEGPVKDKIVGKATAQKVERAKRKVEHMNWQLTEQIVEYRSEMEQGLTQVPIGGAMYMKAYWNPRLNRIATKAVFVDEIYLPYSASSYLAAQRRTHALYKTDQEFNDEVAAGIYAASNMPGTSQEPEKSKTSEVVDKVEGKEPSGYNEDGTRTFYETQIWLTVDGDQFAQGEPVDDGDGQGGSQQLYPYIVTTDLIGRCIVGFYRNWDQELAEKKHVIEEIENTTEYPFIPWRGAYPLSLFHLIGNLSIAATGALRALLDSAHINNMPGLLKLKGGLGSDGGQSKEIDASGITEVDGGVATDDIRKAAMPMPVNPPSNVLFSLLGFLVEAGKGVIRTTFDELSDSNANVPVGTTLARYEQGMVVLSSIHGRMHDAQARFLKVIHRLNRLYLKESQVFGDTGEILARRSDYEGPMDVIPVSDPRIYSDTQRQMQIISVMQRATGNPLYNQRAVEEAFSKNTHFPDAEKLLVEMPTPRRMNAVNENLAAMMGRPISAFPDEDHLSHLMVHVPFWMMPTLGGMPHVVPVIGPIMLEHVKQHVGLFYVQMFNDVISGRLGVEVTELMDADDPDVMVEFDRLLATASPEILAMVNEKLKGIPPVVQQAMQMLQAMQPQAQDPAAQAMMKETDRKAAKDQVDVQVTAAKEQAKTEADQQKLALEAAKMQDAKEKDAAQQKLDAARLALDAEQAEADRRMEAEHALQALADSDADRAAQAVAADADREAENARKEAELNVRHEMNMEDNATAVLLAEKEIAASEKVAVSTGTGMNPQP